MKNKDDVQKILNFVVDAGVALLQSGGELFRVEDTICHICNYYGVDGVDVFLLSNGLFISANSKDYNSYACIKHIPLAPVNLQKVDEINTLSRHICQGKYEIDDAINKLDEIKNLSMKGNLERILAASIGSFGFCYLVEATMIDCVASMVIAFVLYWFVLYGQRNHLSKLILNTFGGALIATLALGIYLLLGQSIINFDKVIIGSIFPLVPGMGFVNAIRDLVNSDMLSGVVRMIDSILVFIYIAIGVGTVLSVFNAIFGGVL